MTCSELMCPAASTPNYFIKGQIEVFCHDHLCCLLFLFQSASEGNNSESPPESLAGQSQVKKGRPAAHLCR